MLFTTAMLSNLCTFCFCFFLFFPLSQHSLSSSSSSSSGWLGRASPPASWPPCPSGQPWRRPMGPLPCLTVACSSTSRPWPACSFNSRLLSSHQVRLRQRAARGGPDPSNPASCLAEVGQSGRWQDRFGCFPSSGVKTRESAQGSRGISSTFKGFQKGKLGESFVWCCMGCGVFQLH